MVIWLIGLSGAGKSTIGDALCDQIRATNRNCVFIDGDVIREVFGNDLGHSLQDRRRNADRICQLCKFLSLQEVNVVCAILSIFPESQDWNRENIDRYFEVFVDAPLELVKQRDIKGIYARAAAGELTDVVGVDLEFPRPAASNLVLENNFERDVSEMASEILEHVLDRLY